MKRVIIIVLLVIAVCIGSAGCGGARLTEAERQQRAEAYSRLLESLQSVGYADDFSLRDSDAMEQNLRRLWSQSAAFSDARKSAELLVLLGNFDFIAEGLRARPSNRSASEDPYYGDWPRDEMYVTSSSAVKFSADEVLWLAILLPDAAIPQAHQGLREVLVANAAEVLRQERPNHPIWVYFERHAPGLLERLDADYWKRRVPAEMAAAYRSADDAIQDRLTQGIDMQRMRDNYVRPRLRTSLSEVDAWLSEFPPTGAWEGGYIRIVSPQVNRYSASMGALALSETYERRSDYALSAVTNPADARFAVYEQYSDRTHYATYHRKDTGEPLEVYVWNLDIRIVDLLTGAEIFSETVRGNPPPDEVSFLSMFLIETSGGEYDHDDFDYDRYAAVMVEYMES